VCVIYGNSVVMEVSLAGFTFVRYM